MPSSPEQQASADVRFIAFFLVWAELKGWAVPAIHIRACAWLATRGNLGVLRCFRGFGKSTILAIYNAWRYYEDPTYRILHQGDQDKTAYKTSRDTKAVLMRHPWTRDRFATGIRGEAAFYWVPGAEDERNPSMQAAGITSNITSSRCDEAQNDDVEVPRNIQNPEAREKMRARLGEQTHCMVPGARQLFIGTPHTHDSLYDEMERMGADCLTIKMFDQEHRIESADKASYSLPFKPTHVFAGIGAPARLLVQGEDYRLTRDGISFARPPGGVIDCYAGHAWPERFSTSEMGDRRRKCKTLNEWDSQYQLHSRPVSETRLDPDKMLPYDAEPAIRYANNSAVMTLGAVRIVGMACRWDPSSGKLGSDVSAVAIVLQDEVGRRYWHRSERLTGDVAEFDASGKNIIGGQVWQLCDLVEQFHVPRITVETNGIGAFAPTVLRAALKQRRLRCGVKEEPAPSGVSKNKRIVESFEPLLQSAGQLWAHVSVLDGPAAVQMRDFNPMTQAQADDYIDAGAAAVTDTPERLLAHVAGIPSAVESDDWRPSGGAHEVAVEY